MLETTGKDPVTDFPIFKYCHQVPLLNEKKNKNKRIYSFLNVKLSNNIFDRLWKFVTG